MKGGKKNMAERGTYHDYMIDRLGGEATVREEREKSGEKGKVPFHPLSLKVAPKKETLRPGK